MQFSQRDPRWAADLLGSSEITIGKAGCLVTAAAAMMAVRAHWMSKDSQYLSRGKTVPETGMQIL